MNAKPNLDRSIFVVIWGGERDVYSDRSEVEHRMNFIAEYELSHRREPVAVVESNPVEGWSNDITADFADADDLAEADAYDRAHIPSPAELLREYHGLVL